MNATQVNQATLVIEAGRTERHYWRDLWRYRELSYLTVVFKRHASD